MTDASFDEFYRASQHRVGTFLYALCGDLGDAQDAAQEAYARAWQIVNAYARDKATAAMANLNAQVLACARFDNERTDGEITMTVVAESFAGEDSILVATESSTGRWLNAVVQQGNLVSGLAVYPVDEAGVKTMAERAAARMCSVTHTCR